MKIKFENKKINSVPFMGQIMSAYKYLGIFSRQMEAIVHLFAIYLFICSFFLFNWLYFFGFLYLL